MAPGRLARWTRDAHMFAQTMIGRAPTPFADRVPRGGRSERAAPPTPVLAPRLLRVTEVVRETPDAVTLWLRDPSGKPIPFVAGQFFTLLVTQAGTTLRRAYSACSDARDPSRVAVTIKRMPEGRVSGFMNEQAEVGMDIAVLGPSGDFVLDEGAERVVMIAGGSGITPIAGMLRTHLDARPNASFDLVYGNRAERDVIFRHALTELALAYPDRLRIHWVLSEPAEGWSGRRGMLDEPTLSELLDGIDASHPLGAEARFLMCGPDPMMDAARAALEHRGITPDRILAERFTQPQLRTDELPRATEPQIVRMKIDGTEHRLTVPPDASLLEAGLAAGIPMPYSCAMGGCGACKARVDRGRVIMQEPNCLTPGERDRGYVLTCVGYAAEEAELTYDTAGPS